MTEVPIEVRVTVGDRVGTLVTVGDPSDAMTAHRIGQAVSVFVMEQTS